jgi:hypothetical protein
MSVLAKHIVVWLILVTVPAQGLAAATTALRGPAHYHDAVPVPDQLRHARLTHAHYDSHDGHHAHEAHPGLQRHYHLPGEDAVVVRDDPEHDATATGQRDPTSETVGAAFVALISDPLAFHLPDLIDAVGIGRVKKLLSCFCRRIERPPRLPFA